MSKDRSKDKADCWKAKAVARSREIKKLRSQNVALQMSRAGWKKKYQSLRIEFSPCRKTIMGAADRHHFSLNVVEFCLRFCQYGGVSLRSCRNSLLCFVLIFGLKIKVPSHVSIRNWQLKIGHYRHHRTGLDIKRPGQWALIVDESVTIGSERLLVILGLEIGSWSFERSPRFEDVEVLFMGCSKEWKSSDVQAALKAASCGLEVVQGVSDAGRNLLSAFELLGLLHLPDCSHAMARILERHLSEDTLFKQMGILGGKLRQYWTTSEYANFRPPQHRGKSRFMNVFAIVKWAARILKQASTLPAQVREKTDWLFQNQDFIEDLCVLNRIADRVFQSLKSKGASTASIQKAQLAAATETCSERINVVWKDILAYLEKLIQKTTEKNTPLICCSDIIESLFGRFKYRVNPASEISDIALIIPILCGHLSASEIKQGLEKTKIKHIKHWKRK